MNGSANDTSGNGNNGTGYNLTPAAGIDGVMGHAWYFNGSNSYISVPYAPILNTNTYSIAVVIKVMGFNSGTCQANTILERGDALNSSPTGSYGMSFDDN